MLTLERRRGGRRTGRHSEFCGALTPFPSLFLQPELNPRGGYPWRLHGVGIYSRGSHLRRHGRAHDAHSHVHAPTTPRSWNALGSRTRRAQTRTTRPARAARTWSSPANSLDLTDTTHAHTHSGSTQTRTGTRHAVHGPDLGALTPVHRAQIGRASCRERVCQYV